MPILRENAFTQIAKIPFGQKIPLAWKQEASKKQDPFPRFILDPLDGTIGTVCLKNNVDLDFVC